MARKAGILLVAIALAVAAAKPASESASGLIPSDDRLPPEDMQVSPDAEVVRLPDEDNEVDDEVDDELGDEEAMDGAETVVFRPLFVHRQRQARRQQRRLEQQRRDSYYGRPLPRVYY